MARIITQVKNRRRVHDGLQENQKGLSLNLIVSITRPILM